jgi:hypothetical protein
MPAAPFFEISVPEVVSDESSAQAIRQHAIGPKQCRWIIADEDAGAEALMCGALTVPHRPFCAVHCARAYMKLEGEAEESAEAEAEEEPEQEAAE